MEISLLTDAPLYAALILLGLAYFFRTYSMAGRRPVMRGAYSPFVRKWQAMAAVGWITLGVNYIAFVPAFISSSDYVNAAVFAAILPFSLYIAYHEFLSVRYRQEMKTLRFLNGVVFLFVLPVTLADRVPAVNGAMVYSFAWQSAKLLSLFGYEMDLTSVDYQHNPMLYRTNDNFISTTLAHGSHADTDIDIILSCTALPSMLLFAAAIACSPASFREKIRTGALLVALIHVLNVVRVSLLSFLIYEGFIDDFVAHAVVGKVGSIIILLLLVILLFRRIPWIQDYIYRLFILRHRGAPGAATDGTGGIGTGNAVESPTGHNPPAGQQRSANDPVPDGKSPVLPSSGTDELPAAPGTTEKD